MIRLLIIGLLSLFTASFQTTYGQTMNTDMKMTSPPYIARTSNFMAIAFHIKADEVQSLVPANVKVKIDEKGQATVGMEIYTTEQVYGIPNYTLAFIYVTVNSLDSNNNTSDNYYPIWGAMNNDTALQSFKHFYNFPYQQQSVTIRKGAEQVATVGEGNGEGITLKLRTKSNSPVSAEGVAPILNQSADGKMQVTEIPWLANGNEASIISFEIRAGSNKVLQVLQGAEPFYGQVSTNVFSYTKPKRQ
jgi:hypothetical protein